MRGYKHYNPATVVPTNIMRTCQDVTSAEVYPLIGGFKPEIMYKLRSMSLDGTPFTIRNTECWPIVNGQCVRYGHITGDCSARPVIPWNKHQWD